MLTVWALPGIAEVSPGDNLADLISAALEAAAAEGSAEATLRDGDILAVTSKIVSKAEGRLVRADDREDAITAETVRVVATRVHPGRDDAHGLRRDRVLPVLRLHEPALGLAHDLRRHGEDVAVLQLTVCGLTGESIADDDAQVVSRRDLANTLNRENSEH